MNKTPSPPQHDPSRDLRRAYLRSLCVILGLSITAQFVIPWALQMPAAPERTIFVLTMLAIFIEVVFVFEPAVRGVQSQIHGLQKMLSTAQELSNPPAPNPPQTTQEVFAVYRDANEPTRHTTRETTATDTSHPDAATDSNSAAISVPEADGLQTLAIPGTPQILLVEDNEINQMLAHEVLIGNGWQCQIAANGSEALQAIESQAYDLILMDCQMPIMDGFSLTQEIRNRQLDGRVRSPCPIIAVTANALKEDRQKCIDAGMDDYLAKPFNPKQLTEIVQQWLPQTLHNRTTPTVDTPQPETQLPFARQEFMERCMGDLGFAESLLESFESDSRARVDEIVMYANQRDATAAGNAAHTLKGMAGILAAHPLQSIAAEIERAGRQDDLEDIVDLIDDLQSEVSRCLAFIPSLTQRELERA
ncbi:Sensor histidine kinase RcsC [Rosistilla ulvae]|uniref:Sensor histidine kinase RcsC n=1 Tax=Rosistilla ulvae TaxID=1930277 RepID=A0A517LTV3_9BACT|nr:response regulator [Rosistilla ulvae]QDS86052.1 Sensor histidine kinase RcsC [Rosistilla ulvae]